VWENEKRGWETTETQREEEMKTEKNWWENGVGRVKIGFVRVERQIIGESVLRDQKEMEGLQIMNSKREVLWGRREKSTVHE